MTLKSLTDKTAGWGFSQAAIPKTAKDTGGNGINAGLPTPAILMPVLMAQVLAALLPGHMLSKIPLLPI